MPLESLGDSVWINLIHNYWLICLFLSSPYTFLLLALLLRLECPGGTSSDDRHAGLGSGF